MNQVILTVLRFIGGPFDGFSQHVPADLSDLPAGLSLPIDSQSGRVFGVDCCQPGRAAIYRLVRDQRGATYHFLGIRSSNRTPTP